LFTVPGLSEREPAGRNTASFRRWALLVWINGALHALFLIVVLIILLRS
jgi:hypothetical protein